VGEEEVSGSEADSKLTPQPLEGVDKYLATDRRMDMMGLTQLTDSASPTVVDSRELRDTYKCGHCGHMWAELREDSGMMRAPSEAVEELTEQDVNGPKPPKVGED
jgi:hypothetical protein